MLPPNRAAHSEGAVSVSSLLTAEQVAAQLGMKEDWVYARSREWVRSNGTRGIPTVTLGKYRRYRQEAIDRWVAGLESGEATA